MGRPNFLFEAHQGLAHHTLPDLNEDKDEHSKEADANDDGKVCYSMVCLLTRVFERVER